MKKITFMLIALSFCIISNVWAQEGVAINTTGADPDNSAILDVASTTKGLLIPRMNQTQRNAISSPATGLMIYQTDNAPGYYFYNGSGWAITGSGALGINDLIDGKTDATSVFLGSGSGANNLGGSNVAVGIGTLKTNTTGSANTANGCNALFSNTVGHSNTAYGHAASYNNTNGTNNTAIGKDALFCNTTAPYNTAIGAYANFYNQEGLSNTIIGYSAGRGTSLHNKTGNVFLGYLAGYNATTGSDLNVFLGYEAGYSETGSNKLYIENSNSTSPLIYGEFDNNLLRVNGTLDINNAYQFPTTDGSSGQVLQSDGSGTLGWASDGGATEINELTDGKTDATSVFLGSGAGANDDGSDNQNVAVGIGALNANTSGYYNTANGYQALYSNTTGIRNTANGYQTLYSNTTGRENTANGHYALYSNTAGNRSTANGSQALYFNTTGGHNTANGYWALHFNTTGHSNTANGYLANLYNQEGSYNTIIGFEAGRGTSLHSNTGNVFVGYRAGFSAATGSDKNVFLGYDAGFSETGSNKLYIENSNSTSPLIYGEFDNNLLRVNGTLDINNAYQFPTTDGAPGQLLQSDGSGTLSWATASGDFSNGGEAGGADRSLGNTDNFALGFLTNNATRLHIANDGNIGIGTTTPGDNLHIQGSGIVRSIIETTTDGSSGSAAYRMVRPSSAAWAAFDFAHGVSSDNQWGFGLKAGSTGLSFWDATQSDVIRFYIEQTTGNIGIGNTSPTAKLDVSGTTGYDQLRMRTSFTPSSTTDVNGNTGDIAWDNSYMYIKTSVGWKRAALSTW